mmetsp:Transcript_9491/g.23305  ORF Transcript_9491/g.23305 Transcript_9491/m.23305 type:complete len:544 (-) Transcript_9491:912-2543(-)
MIRTPRATAWKSRGTTMRSQSSSTSMMPPRTTCVAERTCSLSLTTQTERRRGSLWRGFSRGRGNFLRCVWILSPAPTATSRTSHGLGTLGRVFFTSDFDFEERHYGSMYSVKAVRRVGGRRWEVTGNLVRRRKKLKPADPQEAEPVSRPEHVAHPFHRYLADAYIKADEATNGRAEGDATLPALGASGRQGNSSGHDALKPHASALKVSTHILPAQEMRPAPQMSLPAAASRGTSSSATSGGGGANHLGSGTGGTQDAAGPTSKRRKVTPFAACSMTGCSSSSASGAYLGAPVDHAGGGTTVAGEELNHASIGPAFGGAGAGTSSSSSGRNQGGVEGGADTKDCARAGTASAGSNYLVLTDAQAKQLVRKRRAISGEVGSWSQPFLPMGQWTIQDGTSAHTKKAGLGMSLTCSVQGDTKRRYEKVAKLGVFRSFTVVKCGVRRINYEQDNAVDMQWSTALLLAWAHMQAWIMRCSFKYLEDRRYGASEEIRKRVERNHESMVAGVLRKVVEMCGNELDEDHEQELAAYCAVPREEFRHLFVAA